MDESLPDFFCLTQQELLLMNFVLYFRYIDWFLRYLRSKSKVVLNCAEFWTFFALTNFKGWCPQMLYISDNAHLMAHHMAKFYGVTSP